MQKKYYECIQGLIQLSRHMEGSHQMAQDSKCLRSNKDWTGMAGNLLCLLLGAPWGEGHSCCVRAAGPESEILPPQKPDIWTLNMMLWISGSMCCKTCEFNTSLKFSAEGPPVYKIHNIN